MVIWLIGLSSSGKTTIAKEIIKLLKKQNKSSILVDGDEGRKVWGDDLGHDILSREINAGRLSRLCQVLDQQNVEVVGAVLSLFPKWQNWNRKNFSQYYEVYLDVPMHILEKRDPKLIYKRARQGKLKNVANVWKLKSRLLSLTWTVYLFFTIFCIFSSTLTSHFVVINDSTDITFSTGN